MPNVWRYAARGQKNPGAIGIGPGFAGTAARLAEAVECHLQVLGDNLRRAAFDVVPLQEMDQLAVLEQGDTGRRRRVGQQKFASLGRRFLIYAGEYRRRLVGRFVVLHGHFRTRAGVGGRASTYGIDHQQGRTLRLR